MKDTKLITKLMMTASLYVIVSLVIPYISYGPLQFRIAEVLCVLVLIDKKYIFAITLGCFLTNLIGALTGANLLGYLDVILGTFATYISLVFTYKFRNVLTQGKPALSLLMPVIFNAIIIGLELAYVLFPTNIFYGFIIMFGQIFITQFVICFILGIIVHEKLKSIDVLSLEM